MTTVDVIVLTNACQYTVNFKGLRMEQRQKECTVQITVSGKRIISSTLSNLLAALQCNVLTAES